MSLEFTAQIETDQNRARTTGGGNTAGFATAEFTWTVNGISQRRVIDAVAGATLTGVAESLRVIIKDVTDVTVFPAGVTYGVTVSVAARTRPTTAVPPVLTVALAQSLAAAAEIEFDVPVGANSIAVYGTQTGGGTPILQIDEKAFYSPVDSHVVLETVPRLGEFTPLLTGVQRVGVTNVGGAGAVVTVVFGIDG